MRKKPFTIVLLILTIVCSAWGQTRRIVLLEEATNASCGPCAENNGILQSFVSKNFGGVVTVRYHASWPGYDPMYAHNQEENNRRTSYYGIAGVPTYLLDGVDYGTPSNPEAMKMNMYRHLNQPAPVKILIETETSPDTVNASVTLIGIYPFSAGQLHLRIAIIERMIIYETAPGTNGETVFPDVMRKMLPDADGVAISSLEPGDTLHYQFSYPVHVDWLWNDLAVVTWLQSDETREVFQATINEPTFCIASLTPPADVLDVNQSVIKEYVLCNENPDTLHLRITLEAEHVPEGWTHSLAIGEQTADSLDLSLSPFDSLRFRLSIQTGSLKSWMRVSILARNLDDPYGYGFSRTYFGIIPVGDILFVDDDGNEPYESAFLSAFDHIGEPFTIMEEPDLLALSDRIDMDRYQSLFWNVSWGFPSFVPEDIELLRSYLDEGGNLFLSGQDIGWDIFDPAGHSNFPEARDFFHDYLDADYLGDNGGRTRIVGTPGDPITDGISFDLLSVYALYPEWIDSYSSRSIPILTYSGLDRHVGLRFDSGIFKTVYIGLGLEQMSDTLAARQIIERTLTWFNEETGVEPVPETRPEDFNLSQNYPNPFNSTTTISYQLSAVSDLNTDHSPLVTLKVYNLLGQEVKTLVDQFQQPGFYTVTWDGKDGTGGNVSSGIYFYRIQANIFTKTGRMMLMK